MIIISLTVIVRQIALALTSGLADDHVSAVLPIVALRVEVYVNVDEIMHFPALRLFRNSSLAHFEIFSELNS